MNKSKLTLTNRPLDIKDKGGKWKFVGQVVSEKWDVFPSEDDAGYGCVHVRLPMEKSFPGVPVIKEAAAEGKGVPYWFRVGGKSEDTFAALVMSYKVSMQRVGRPPRELRARHARLELVDSVKQTPVGD